MQDKENDFNSIKVQLKRDGPYPEDGYRQFQFHKGTIKTLLQAVNTLLQRHFNSIKVQLKRTLWGTGRLSMSVISIP